MQRIVIAWKLVALTMVTFACALPPLVVRVLTLGAAGPSGWVGSRCSVLWSRVALRILAIRVSIEGRPEGKVFLVAANHLSYLDIWLLGSLYPAVFVAKREIASWPLFGWIASVAGTLFVDRENARSLVRTSRMMKTLIGRGVSVNLFAEGQATHGESVQPFMPSLFEPAAAMGIPCYGASLTYDAPSSPDPPSDTVCWWDSTSFLFHIVRLMKLPRVEARLVFSESPVRSSDRKELARRLQAEVTRNFVPVRQQRLEETARPTPRVHSREISQTPAPKKSHGRRPSSHSAGSAEK